MYAQLPQMIDPIALVIGDFAVRWYGVMWLCAFAVAYGILWWRLRRGEGGALRGLDSAVLGDVVMAALLGAVIGGRIGYVLFYDFAFFAHNPLAVIWPFADGQFIGISGMSFHGGVVGVSIALWLFARRRKWSFLALTDFVAIAVPLGYAFGRIGNFLNHELWGRVTQSSLGMFFAQAPDGGTLLRHPSQLYEALLEGVFLGVALFAVRKRYTKSPGVLSGLFLIGYSCARIFVEFFRAPDVGVSLFLGVVTRGQLLSVVVLIVGGVLIARGFYDKKV